MKTMKAVVFRGKNLIGLDEVPKPVSWASAPAERSGCAALWR